MTISVHAGEPELYLTADQAAEVLGVSRATLYAYVSRRGIRSVAVNGSRERVYWKVDVLGARRAKGRPRKQVVENDQPESAISLIGPAGLYYRGADAVALSERATLEEVAALLWNVPVEVAFTDRVPHLPPTAVRVREILRDASGVEQAIAILPLVEAANPRSYDFSAAGLAATGADVLRTLTAIVLGAESPSAAPVHEVIGGCRNLSPEWTDFARRLLVLSADHGFEPGSHAVRSVASIGVSPYRSVTTGLLLAGGRRTQLGRFDTLARVLNEIVEGDADTAILPRLREGEAIPGFGFHSYVNGDPRAHALLDRLDLLASDDVALIRLKRAIAMVHDALGLWPDFAFVAQFCSRYMGQDRRNALFVLGRCCGWIAHAIEQYLSGEAMRPASVYTGHLPDS